MARKRMIDPDIWDSEQVQALSPQQFKLFIYLISNADDEGRQQYSARMIAAKAFPLDDEYTADNAKNDIAYMQQIGLIHVYENDGNVYISHPNWQRYQTINRPKQSKYPNPDDCVTYHGLINDESVINHGSITPNRKEENLKEEKRNRAPSAAVSQPVQVSEGESELYHKVKTVFEREQPAHRFTDYGKEGKAIKGLIAKARARSPDEPDVFLAGMIKQFQALRKNGDKFWRGQPFLPSALNASGIFDRVLSAAQRNYEDTKQAAENWEEIEF